MLHLCPPHPFLPAMGLWASATTPPFLTWVLVLNSGPYACPASTLPTEPSLQSPRLSLKQKWPPFNHCLLATKHIRSRITLSYSFLINMAMSRRCGSSEYLSEINLITYLEHAPASSSSKVEHNNARQYQVRGKHSNEQLTLPCIDSQLCMPRRSPARLVAWTL